jgi:hypothetical protein
MKPGGGKAKGAQFERYICKRLSLFITEGKHEDVFWRSAMSGGRATIKAGVRQGGDITAVTVEGYDFCEDWNVECKHVKHLGLDSFIVRNTGPMAKYWQQTQRDAKKQDKTPMLICRQNGWPILVVVPRNRTSHFGDRIDVVAMTPKITIFNFDDWTRL